VVMLTCSMLNDAELQNSSKCKMLKIPARIFRLHAMTKAYSIIAMDSHRLALHMYIFKQHQFRSYQLPSSRSPPARSSTHRFRRSIASAILSQACIIPNWSPPRNRNYRSRVHIRLHMKREFAKYHISN